MASRAQSKVLTDQEEIRKWAEERGAQPACVQGTGEEGDVGMLRLEFPGAPGARDESLQPISWDDWFRKFDERGLAFLVQEETARGQKSNFNKIISRETAEAREQGETQGGRRSRGRRSTGKGRAVAATGGRSRSAQKAAKSSSSGTRAASRRKKTTKAASSKSSGSKSRTAAASKGSSGRKSTSAKPPGNVRSISSGRRSSSSGSASARGRASTRSRRAA
jgi:hypothetical protein